MVTKINIQQLNWTKNNGLIPVIIQHVKSGEVLMLGHMNKESIIKTEQTGYVTFFSRSKNKLWTKGEKSGNTLKLMSWHSDCDQDALLIFVMPKGPTCHNNTNSCFHPATTELSFIYRLENIISTKKNKPLNTTTQSYTAHLYASGTKRIAQKVGEEGLETALAAIAHQNNTKEFINEASDLIYHLLVLIQHKSLTFSTIIQELQTRNRNNNKQSNYSEIKK